MAGEKATIPVSPQIRDRIKTFGSMGSTYDEILERMMYELDRNHDLARLRREVDDPETEWVDLEDSGW